MTDTILGFATKALFTLAFIVPLFVALAPLKGLRRGRKASQSEWLNWVRLSVNAIPMVIVPDGQCVQKTTAGTQIAPIKIVQQQTSITDRTRICAHG